MSIMRCDKHGHWDSDVHEICPRCDNGPDLSLLAKRLRCSPNTHYAKLLDIAESRTRRADYADKLEQECNRLRAQLAGERDRCAKVCEERIGTGHPKDSLEIKMRDDEARDCAAAIRSLPTQAEAKGEGEHWCGLSGYRLGIDKCPACDAARAHKEEEG